MLRPLPLLVAVAVLAACGDSGGGVRLTKSAWIVKADAICARTHATIQKLPDPHSLKEFASYGAKAVAATNGELKDLRALQPPKSDEPTITAMLASVDKVLATSRQIVVAAQKNDASRIQQLVGDSDKLDADANARARAYGLQACGSA